MMDKFLANLMNPQTKEVAQLLERREELLECISELQVELRDVEDMIDDYRESGMVDEKLVYQAIFY